MSTSLRKVFPKECVWATPATACNTVFSVDSFVQEKLEATITQIKALAGFMIWSYWRICKTHSSQEEIYLQYLTQRFPESFQIAYKYKRQIKSTKGLNLFCFDSLITPTVFSYLPFATNTVHRKAGQWFRPFKSYLCNCVAAISKLNLCPSVHISKEESLLLVDHLTGKPNSIALLLFDTCWEILNTTKQKVSILLKGQHLIQQGAPYTILHRSVKANRFRET